VASATVDRPVDRISTRGPECLSGAEKITFIKNFVRLARQLNTYAIAGDWMRLAVALEAAGNELTAAEAATWANHGYLPEEAGPLIADKITADRQAELEQHAADQVSGHEALAALRIAELHAAGVLSRHDVVTVQDPTDPRREIIMPRDELR
jgi:hypothetical protein